MVTGETASFTGAVKSSVAMCQHLSLYEASLILVIQVKGQLLEEYGISLYSTHVEGSGVKREVKKSKNLKVGTTQFNISIKI